MNRTRRSFIKRISIAGCLSGIRVRPGWSSESTQNEVLSRLDTAALRPVLRKELFGAPIVISEIELLHHDDSFICKVTSTDGASGLSVSNNLRMEYLYPIFLKRVAPFFRGKDARALDELVDGVYRFRSNYKMQSYAVGVPVATIEFAILDLLGTIAGVSLGALLGTVVNKRIPVYLATRFRDQSANASIEKAKALISEGGYKAVKFKIGEKMGANQELVPGRTERLIPLARREFGDKMWLGVDANGGFDVKKAIAVGRLLEENRYGFFEEPVPFDWYRETKEVADNVGVAIAGGEQEASHRNFRWMAAENTLQVFRPDIFYFGGMIRSMRVCRMAHAVGATCVPHISGSGLGYLYALQFISAIPNAGDYHPNSRDEQNPVPLECRTSTLQVQDGKVSVPTGPGLGVEIDQDFVAKHRRVVSL